MIWTGLPGNFKEQTEDSFSIENAIRHLQSLPAEVQPSAVAYIRQAPDLVITPLRTALQSEPWFATDDAGTNS